MKQYVFKEYPKVIYGPNGASRVIQDASQKPEGWAEHPSLVGKTATKKTADAGTGAPEAGADTQASIDVTTMTKDQIMAKLDAMNVQYKKTAKVSTLSELLLANLDEAEDDTETPAA